VFVHRLHRAVASLGHDVEVVQRGDWSPPWPLYRLDASFKASHEESSAFHDTLDGVRLHHPLTVRPRPSRFFHGDSWQREADSLRRYARLYLARRGFDAVLAHFLVPDGYHALALGEELQLPVAAMAWGDDVHAWPSASVVWAAKVREVIRSADALVACSERMARDAMRWMDEPLKEWNVVYGGVDLDRHRPIRDRAGARARALPNNLMDRIPSGAKLLLVLAQPAVAKGYVELLDAWARLGPGHDDWWLVMAGGPGGDLNIPSEIARRGLSRTEWLGPQPPERIPDLLGASDAFVLPSHNEGLSLSVLEAMATGLPTITTDVGGHAEVMRTADEGWLIPPKDVSALTGALTSLMTSGEQRRQRGTNGRRAAERIGSPLDNARKLVAILDGIVAPRQRARRAARFKSFASVKEAN